jgi:hypothetical protein
MRYKDITESRRELEKGEEVLDSEEMLSKSFMKEIEEIRPI